MRASLFAVPAVVFSIWLAMPADGLAIGCTQAQVAQCASVLEVSSCMPWQCIPKPPKIAGEPKSYSCVQGIAPAGTLCHNAQACIHSGTCGPTGACQPNAKQQETCLPTATDARDQISCYCSNYACQARMANGTLYAGTVSPMCKSSIGP